MNFLVDRAFTEREMRLANQRLYRRHFSECPSCCGDPTVDCVLCLRTCLVSKATAAAWEPPEVPRGYCQCGCGQETDLATRTRHGNTKGEPRRWIKGHKKPARWAPRHVLRDTGYETRCWLWLLGKNDHGYGHFYTGEKDTLQSVYAHRWYYEQLVGPIPEGLELDHLCRVPSCVNPKHLEPVTHAENMRRSKLTKLSDADIEAIRAAPSATSNLELADRFGIESSYVSRVRRGLTHPTLDYSADAVAYP